MKVAVIGSGISGLAAAWLMRKHADVRLYEKNGYAGGHTNTIQVPGGPAVDTGFIVFNERNYPELTAMLRHLKVESQASDMSFSASIGGGKLEYAGDNLNTLFAQRWNPSTAATGACCWTSPVSIAMRSRLSSPVSTQT